MKKDIIIIGAGLAGTSAAMTLASAGYDIALIDARAEYPQEFRAEKMGRRQIEQFDRLGLGAVALRHVTACDHMQVARFGQVLSESTEPEYGFRYGDLINGLRGALPPHLNVMVGRVSDIATSDDRQIVTLQDETVIEARLVVLATGLGEAVKKLTGIERTVQSPVHSISLGFTMAAPAASFPFKSMVYYGDGPKSRIAYISLFPIGSVMRANLFVYRDMDDGWVRDFRAAPASMMEESMPALRGLCGTLDVAGPVAMRPIDLSVARGYRRDGVVLVGDAFMTCCPIVGVGIKKSLTDVERLCLHHLPQWFETPGMGAGKIAAFYDDEIKRASDAGGHAMSVYSRSIATDPRLVWAVRRVRNKAARQGGHMLKTATRAVLGHMPGRLFHRDRVAS